MFFTEDGISSDNGSCLSPDNYAWDRCMTYAAAGQSLESKHNTLRAEYGDRLRLYIVYSLRDLRDPGVTNLREHYFGAVKNNGTDKGELTAAVRRIMAK